MYLRGAGVLKRRILAVGFLINLIKVAKNMYFLKEFGKKLGGKIL